MSGCIGREMFCTGPLGEITITTTTGVSTEIDLCRVHFVALFGEIVGASDGARVTFAPDDHPDWHDAACSQPLDHLGLCLPATPEATTGKE